jgi:type I restriction enzyme S subunit
VSFPQYPSYKDSGVEWLGQVPGHWEVKRVGYYFNERREKVSDKDYPALSVTKNGIVPQLDTAAKSDDGDNRKRVCNGDFVINSRSDRKGSAGASDLDGSVSLICTVLRPQERVHTPFIHHLLRSQPFQEEFYRNGKGIVADLWSTNYSEMRNILLGMPPLPEQTAIAEFLDRETGKVDELVAEQRRLMELLKEKRQAVISHAVTRGLNPTAPLKPSGIEWLGDLPEHWEVGKLSRLISTRKGIAFKAEDFTDEGVPVVKASDIKGLTIRRSETCLPESFLEQYPKARLKTGDLVLSTVGSSPEVRNSAVGQLGMVPEALSESLLNQNTVVFSPSSMTLMNDFLFLILQTVGYRDHLDLHAHGTANQASINVSDMLDFFIPLPGLAEQEEIARFISEELAKFDTLTAEAQRAIDLLQERRTALISAAVTGQIDVRSAVAAS